jgi:hypothetical protein
MKTICFQNSIGKLVFQLAVSFSVYLEEVAFRLNRFSQILVLSGKKAIQKNSQKRKTIWKKLVVEKTSFNFSIIIIQ